VDSRVEDKTNFLDGKKRSNKILPMFEDISREELRDAAPPSAVSVISREDGEIVIRQGRPAGGADPCIVLSRQQAFSLIDAIERAIRPAK
jgi:hypothetical protein